MKMTENTTVLGESTRYFYWAVIYESILVLFAEDKQTDKIHISHENVKRVMEREGKEFNELFSDEVLDWMIEFKNQFGYPPLTDLPVQAKQEAIKMLGTINFKGIE